MSACQRPRPTRRVINPGTGPLAWCPGCQKWKPAAQVPWGQERRNPATGKIVATFAPLAHRTDPPVTLEGAVLARVASLLGDS